MSKKFLLYFGIVVAVMGILGLPVFDGVLPEAIAGTEPVWHALAKIVVGAVAAYVAYTDK